MHCVAEAENTFTCSWEGRRLSRRLFTIVPEVGFWHWAVLFGISALVM
jgi:hypothetical protein